MKDVKKGKEVTKKYSRGVAFVEFSKHEHALVALRVLNNNPGKVVLCASFFSFYMAWLFCLAAFLDLCCS